MVVELQGAVVAIQTISSQGATSPLRPCSLRLQDSLDLGADVMKNQDSMLDSIESESLVYEFADNHGKNIHLLDGKKTASRIRSFNHAIVCTTKPLCKGGTIRVSV